MLTRHVFIAAALDIERRSLFDCSGGTGGEATFLQNAEHASCLDLIEAKTTGFFDLLDEESKLPTPRPDHFTAEVHNRNKGHPRLDVSDEHGSPAVHTRTHLSSIVSTKIQTPCIA